MVDLIDERRAVQSGDEAGRVALGGVTRGRVVEVELAHRPAATRTGDLANEGRLADLACAGDEDDARVIDPFLDERFHASIDHACHGAAVRWKDGTSMLAKREYRRGKTGLA